MSSLYESGQFTDVVITVGTRLFRAHKSVLCARSPVFGAMFGNDFTENRDNQIRITNCEHVEAFVHFLRYLYTDQVSDTVLEQFGCELLALSDKVS